MLRLVNEIKEKRNLDVSTATNYMRILFKLNADRPFNNLAWLKNVDSVNVRLEEYAKSTQRSYITAIVSMLSLYKDKPTYKKIYAYWYGEMMDRGNAEKQEDSKVKSERQEKNWVSWDVVKGHTERLWEEANKIKDRKELSASDWDTFLSMMVLSLYTEFAPRRNQDYQYMKVVMDPKKATDNAFNYFVVQTGEFVFHKYKTARTYGEQKFSVPKELLEVIHLYISKHPLNKGKWKYAPFFLVTFDGKPLVSVNSITRILNRIFGKSVGSSMLRHIYLSSKYNVAEMDADADKMGHSSEVQHKYMKGEGETVSEVQLPSV